jgi:putative phosphoesterase
MARVAVVTDIHANLTALEAVIGDLRNVAPDVVVHGGDLVGAGARPAEVIDRLRDLGWPGVYGNSDEMLWRPERMSEVLHAPHLSAIRQGLLQYTIPWTRETIGEERLAWLRALPLQWSLDALAVVHASADDVWPIVPAAAGDDELERAFGTLERRVVVYGHIHHPFIRCLPSRIVANAGAVSLSFDGDARASYALVEGDRVSVRRVEYDVEAEIALLQASRDPFRESTIRTLRTGRP